MSSRKKSAGSGKAQAHGAKPKLIDPLDIFVNADGYFLAGYLINIELSRVAGEMIRQRKTAYVHLVTPSCVLGAFCLELYLKCLEALDWNRNPRGGHNLKDLFLRLKPETQKLAEEYFNQYSARSNKEKQRQGLDVAVDLLSELEKCATAFEFFRYAYEMNSSPQSYTLGSLEYGLRKLILERKPEWISSAACPPIPPASPAP